MQVRLDDDVAAELRARADDDGRSAAQVANAVLRLALGLTVAPTRPTGTPTPPAPSGASLRAPTGRRNPLRGIVR